MLITLKEHEDSSALMEMINTTVQRHILENRPLTECAVNDILNMYKDEVKEVSGMTAYRLTHGWKPATLKFLFQMDEFTIFFPQSEMLSKPSGVVEEFKRDISDQTKELVIQELNRIAKDINKLKAKLEEDN